MDRAPARPRPPRLPRFAGAAARVLATTVAVAAVLAATAACSHRLTVDEARARDRECADASTAAALARSPHAWVAVQDGDVAAVGPAADDAVRAAAAKSADTPHRFVYRQGDPGDRLYRLAYLPEGGLVAGRRFLSDLGFRIVSAGVPGPGRTVVLDRRGSRRRIDLTATPRVRVELATLAGVSAGTIDVPLDPDFDGPLLLPAETAEPLDLDRAEIPGTAEVQVALGRPFDARRAWVAARCPDLDASGPAEVLVRTAPGTVVSRSGN